MSKQRNAEDFNSSSDYMETAEQILRVASNIVVKQSADETGVDLRDEVWELRDALEQGGIDLDARIAATFNNSCELPPYDRLTELWDLVEVMLDGVCDSSSESQQSEIEAIMHYLRHGDFNSLLQDEELMEYLAVVIGAHHRDNRDIEQFYHFVLFMRRMQFAMDSGPVQPGGTYDAVFPEDPDEDDSFQLGDPLF